jgi:hypothetical protein
MGLKEWKQLGSMEVYDWAEVHTVPYPRTLAKQKWRTNEAQQEPVKMCDRTRGGIIIFSL